MAGRPLEVKDLCNILGTSSEAEVKKALDELRSDYASRESALEITFDDGRYKLEVRSEYLGDVKHLAPQMDMSRAVLTTLSYIAFKQPLKQSYLVHKFGNRIYEYIKELVKRGLINAEPKGHTKELTTTKKLLTYLGEHDAGKVRAALEAAKLKKELEIQKKQDNEQAKVKKQREIIKIIKSKDMTADEWMGRAKTDREEELLKKLEKFEKELEKDYDTSEDEEFEP